jgi:hypothetical protein
MKTKTFVALAVLAGFVSTSASAGEWADACVERLEADGRDTSGCSCLEAEIEANPSLEEEFMSLGEIEDPAERFDAASSEAQAAMSQCTR